jgi:hypothetical protein
LSLFSTSRKHSKVSAAERRELFQNRLVLIAFEQALNAATEEKKLRSIIFSYGARKCIVKKSFGVCLYVFLLSLRNADAHSRTQSVIFVIRFINEKKVNLFRYTAFFYHPI